MYPLAGAETRKMFLSTRSLGPTLRPFAEIVFETSPQIRSTPECAEKGAEKMIPRDPSPVLRWDLASANLSTANAASGQAILPQLTLLDL
jgi:hypothetical protein